MGWYLHAVEQPDGHWACHHGRLLDVHAELKDALAHLREYATTVLGGSAEYFVHYLDGSVDTSATVL